MNRSEACLSKDFLCNVFFKVLLCRPDTSSKHLFRCVRKDLYLKFLLWEVHCLEGRKAAVGAAQRLCRILIPARCRACKVPSMPLSSSCFRSFAAPSPHHRCQGDGGRAPHILYLICAYQVEGSWLIQYGLCHWASCNYNLSVLRIYTSETILR